MKSFFLLIFSPSTQPNHLFSSMSAKTPDDASPAGHNPFGGLSNKQLSFMYHQWHEMRVKLDKAIENKVLTRFSFPAGPGMPPMAEMFPLSDDVIEKAKSSEFYLTVLECEEALRPFVEIIDDGAENMSSTVTVGIGGLFNHKDPGQGGLDS